MWSIEKAEAVFAADEADGLCESADREMSAGRLATVCVPGRSGDSTIRKPCFQNGK